MDNSSSSLVYVVYFCHELISGFTFLTGVGCVVHQQVVWFWYDEKSKKSENHFIFHPMICLADWSGPRGFGIPSDLLEFQATALTPFNSKYPKLWVMQT